MEKTLTFLLFWRNSLGIWSPDFLGGPPTSPIVTELFLSLEGRCTVIIMAVSTMTSGNTNIGESGKSGKILYDVFCVIIRDREFYRVRGTRYSVFIAVLYEPDETGKTT